MSMTGLEVFDTTVHKTNTWLKDVMVELGVSERRTAYDALRVVLHALRDRLTIEEVAELSAQLPMLIRGFYYEGWDPSRTPTRERHLEQFLSRIEEQFPRGGEFDSARVAQAVFAVLSRHVSEGEIADVEHVLPEEIRELWPQLH